MTFDVFSEETYIACSKSSDKTVVSTSSTPFTAMSSASTGEVHPSLGNFLPPSFSTGMTTSVASSSAGGLGIGLATYLCVLL